MPGNTAIRAVSKIISKENRKIIVLLLITNEYTWPMHDNL